MMFQLCFVFSVWIWWVAASELWSRQVYYIQNSSAGMTLMGKTAVTEQNGEGRGSKVHSSQIQLFPSIRAWKNLNSISPFGEAALDVCLPKPAYTNLHFVWFSQQTTCLGLLYPSRKWAWIITFSTGKTTCLKRPNRTALFSSPAFHFSYPSGPPDSQLFLFF